MIVLSWNYRGLENLRTVHELRRMVNDKRSNLVFLMETKLRKKKMENVWTKIGFNNMFVVECVGKSGGLVLFWEDECSVEIQNFSHRHINAIVHNQQMNIDWKFTGFYGQPDATKRFEGWNLLKCLARIAPDPWLCIGDFNVVLVMSEKLGGNLRQKSLMQAFQHTLEACELTDLGFNGPKYTWSNGQEGGTLVRERLDRGVVNFAWRNLFPEAELTIHATTCSDHTPIFFCL